MNRSPVRFPLFFGSTVALGCLLGMVGSTGGMLFSSMGVMVRPLAAEFGWGRGEIYLGATFMTLGIVFGVMTTGHIIDRFGSRRVLIISVVLSILAVGTGPLYITSLPLFYLMLTIGAIVGGPTNTVAYARVIASWFDRRRGLFIGINASGMGLGFALIPPLTEFAVNQGNWHYGYYALGGVMLCMVLPAVIFLIIDTPAKIGMSPDGEGPVTGTGEHAPVQDRNLTLAEAAKTPTFILLLIIACTIAFVLYGTFSQLVPFLGDRGVDSTTAAMVASSAGISMGLARLIVGYLLDHVFAPRLAICIFVVALCGLVLLLYGNHLSLYILAAVCIGFGMGAEGDVVAYLVSRYYGMRHFAAIFSCIFSAYMLGTGFAPPVLGASFDYFGNYSLVLHLFVLMLAGAIMLIFFLPQYDRYINNAKVE